MGVYIKGMEMPTEQYGKMVITLYPNGHVAEYVGDIGRAWEAVPVPVPSHGRLIDADALEADLNIWHGEECDSGFSEEAIDTAPTIISAEY